MIDGLLYPGTYIFAGSPKLGKSFLVSQLAYHVSTGTPLWNYTTRKGTVLYLALEDDYRRLQERLYRMFGTESADNLFFSVSASQLGKGLDEQLQGFITEHLKQALAMQGFRGGSREETEWSQWVQSEKEVLADVMKRHGVEWLQLGTKREHLSVLDYKKEQRTKEIAELESKLADKKDEFEVYQDRISNYSKREQVIEELAKR